MARTRWVFLFALVLLWIGCRGSEPESSSDERVVRVKNSLLLPNVIKGEEAQYMNLAERMRHHQVPAVSIAVIENYKIDWARGYGESEAGTERAVTPVTLFQAASVSKPVAALAALRLVEQGQLKLDEPVNNKLRSWKIPENEFTRRKPVLLRHLLSHNGGLTVHGFPGYARGGNLPTVQQILDGEQPANTAPVRVDKEPGSGFRYSGGGYTILQQLLEDTSGRPFAEFLQETVLDAVGMSESSYRQPLPEGRAAQAATAHDGEGNPVPGNWHAYPEMAAAGLWTTPSDLARFAIEIMKAKSGRPTRVLSADLVNRMLTKEAGEVGLGLFLADEDESFRFFHGGSNKGFRCVLIALPETGQGVAVMTNASNGSALGQEIVRSVARVYGWPGQWIREREVVEVAPEVLEAYIGRYRASGGFTVTVKVEDGRLYAMEGIDKVELRPETETRFFVLEEEREIEFVRDSARNVSELVLNFGPVPIRAARIP